MKITAIGADISKNDVSCSTKLVETIEKNLYKVKELGARNVALTNVTGDDVVVSAFVEDDLLEPINEGIVNILKLSAEDFGDLSGISQNPEEAGEGISYAEASIRPDRYPDAIVLGFDTYGGEPFVADVANSAIEAAEGMKNCTDVSNYIEAKTRKIPGVGYVSPETDDPVVVATVENIESVGVIAGAMIGAALGNKNTYLVKIVLDYDIEHYDLLNYGNHGFNGTDKLIKMLDRERDKYILVNTEAYERYSARQQFNKDVVKYVISNYKKVDELGGYDVYYKER